MKQKRQSFLARAAMTLLLTMLCSTGTWAQGLSGTGTYNDPVHITSSADWDLYATALANGTHYRYAHLDNDITVTTMIEMSEAERSDYHYFYGNNHTLTVNLENTDASVEGVAPFRYFRGNIRELNVVGTISSAGKYTGGIVGIAGNGTNFTDCVVTATITTGADYAGGFVGSTDGDGNPNVSFKNCVFAGTIQSSNSDQHTAGGFFGYGTNYSNFENSLENGTYTNISKMNPRGSTGDYYNPKKVTSLYYFNIIGNVGTYITEANNCFRVQHAAPNQGLYLRRTLHGYDFYQNSSITGLKDTYLYNNGDAVSLGYTLKTGPTTMTEGTDYETTITDSNNQPVDPADLKEVGTYTITFTAKPGNTAGYNGTISGTFTIVADGESLDGYVFSTEGEGDAKVYLISSEADLERLAAYVNSGHDASGLTFKQNADITMTGEHTAIGYYIDYSNKIEFRGTFDGNNLAINNLTINKPNETCQGLFGYPSQSSVIKNVTLNNCDITGGGRTGGIAGFAYGSWDGKEAIITNCHVNGSIKATAENASSHGGIAGQALIAKISDCTVTGTISTTVSNNSYGGIIGFTSQNCNVSNCENAASITGSGDYRGGITANSNSNTNFFTNCLNTGTVEGTNHVGAIISRYSYSDSFTNCYYVSLNNLTAYGNNADEAGRADRAYIITKGAQLSDLVITEDATVTSAIDGKKYYKAGNWTLTLTPNVPADHTFITYSFEGGALTDPTTIDGTHTLTLSGANVTVDAILSDNNGVNMADVTIADIPNQRWKGVAIEPELTVTYNEAPLVKGTDYLVEYSSNAVVGTATITLTGIGAYRGTTTKTFNIVTFAGEGTEENPYQIASESDLQELASIVNSGANDYQNKYLKLTDNITLTEEHTAIGVSSHPFKGKFNGKDGETQYVISNLVINKPEANYQGLFGLVNNATISNVVIDGCNITATNYVGGVAGSSSQTGITNCNVSGAIKVAEEKYGEYHGGIAGYCVLNTLQGCVNTASVTGHGAYFGGITGYSQSQVLQDCVNTASVTGSGECYGGIVGDMRYSTIQRNFNAGTVEGTSYVGSIVGYRNGGALYENYHTAATTGGMGAEGVATGTDMRETNCTAEVVVTITAGDGVTLTLPATPTYFWEEQNQNLYKSGTVVTLDYTKPEGTYFDHYTVNSGEISNAGVIDGEHTLTGDFTANVTINGSYVNEQTDITGVAVIADIADLTYNGSVQHPAPVVTLGNETLAENANYTVKYSEGCINKGTYTVTVTGSGRYIGSVTKDFKIVPFDVSNCTVTVSDKVFTGEVLTVTPTVKRGSTTMTEGSENDYTFTVSPATVQAAGDYTLTITGHGNYTGTKEASFKVYYAVPTALTCTSCTAYTATMTWQENGVATQWMVEYSTDNTFATSETVTVDATTATISGLTPDVTNYVRVKAVYGENEASDWSDVCRIEPTAKVVIGSGTETSYYLPFHNWYYYNLSQQIYTPDELGNHEAGTILSLDFYRTDNNTCNNTIEIYLVKTTKSCFTSTTDWIPVTEADKVYSGKVNFLSNAWTTITLDTPFSYDGTSNLALIVYDPKVSGDSYGNSRYFRSFKVTSEQTLYYLSDSTDPTITPTVTGTRNNIKNQLRIGFDADIALVDDDSQAGVKNSAIIAENAGETKSVKLADRTLYKDGEWNTICLPFDVTLAESPLAGATAKTLTNAQMNGTHVTLTFGNPNSGTQPITELVAGTPYIIKWDGDGSNNIVNPVFTGVTIVDVTEARRTISMAGECVKFIGYFDAFPITAADEDIYYMTAGNTLKHTGKDRTLMACRAYFQFAPSNDVRDFVLDFGDDVVTSIDSGQLIMDNEDGEWYTLDGRKLNGKPTKKGLYILNGRKVVIK